MATLEINIKGVAETQRKLFGFSEKLGERITRLALRSGANYMRKSLRQVAPKRTGRLRRAIAVRNSRINNRRRNGVVGIYLTIRKGKSRKDPKGAYYASWVESGHKQSGKQIPGRYFVRNTFNKLKRPATELIVKNIENAGKQLAGKLK